MKYGLIIVLLGLMMCLVATKAEECNNNCDCCPEKKATKENVKKTSDDEAEVYTWNLDQENALGRTSLDCCDVYSGSKKECTKDETKNKQVGS